jgi:hypothetical protein
VSRTRKADPNDPLSFEKYLSSPQYTDMRGIDGTAATAKAMLQSAPEARRLIFFVQALSHRIGGLPGVVKELIDSFGDRLGTEMMRQIGAKPGQRYSIADTKAVLSALDVLRYSLSRVYNTEVDYDIEVEDPTIEQRAVDYALAACARRAVEKLPGLLAELCINPAIEVSAKSIHIDCFADAFGALIEFERRCARRASEAVAETEVSKVVTETLDRTLKHGKMAVLEGEPGIGKTKAAAAWCEAHAGQARFVSLKGAVNKTTIFRSIGRALGVATGLNRKAAEMQGRIEDMLERSRIMLVIDESHFLFGQAYERVRSRPEMLDWVDTALCNQGVPVALIATPQFTRRLHETERQTLWQSGQFRRRIKDYRRLPAKVAQSDVESVARKMFPDCERAGIKLAMGHAMLSPYPLSWLGDLAQDAREIAETHGRHSPNFSDLDRAIKEIRTPSDLAQATAFDPSKSPTRRRSVRTRMDVLPPETKDHSLESAQRNERMECAL